MRVNWVFSLISLSSPANSLPVCGTLLGQNKCTLGPKKPSFKKKPCHKNFKFCQHEDSFIPWHKSNINLVKWSYGVHGSMMLDWPIHAKGKTFSIKVPEAILIAVCVNMINIPFLEAPCRAAKPVLACRAFTLEAATWTSNEKLFIINCLILKQRREKGGGHFKAWMAIFSLERCLVNL